jgi:hypothetical protein
MKTHNVPHGLTTTPIASLCNDLSRAVNEATRPRRGMSGRDEAGRGATRQAGIGRALPTGWSGRDEVGRGPPGPPLVRDPRPVHSSRSEKRTKRRGTASGFQQRRVLLRSVQHCRERNLLARTRCSPRSSTRLQHCMESRWPASFLSATEEVTEVRRKYRSPSQS